MILIFIPLVALPENVLPYLSLTKAVEGILEVKRKYVSINLKGSCMIYFDQVRHVLEASIITYLYLKIISSV